MRIVFILLFAPLVKAVAALNSFSSSLARSSSNVTYSSSSSPLSISGTPTSRAIAITPTNSVGPTTLEDISIVHRRRLDSIVGALNLSQVPQIPAWLANLDPIGKWPDVDYTTGCSAQRANWPAKNHWLRLQLIAAAWHGGLQDSQADVYIKNQSVRNSISLGMDYWFSRDFVNPACLNSGGTPHCPCTNPDNTLWNTNWFSNVILIPNLVGQACLLLNETLKTAHFNNCTRITGRSYCTFNAGASYLTGANILNIAKIGIDGALLSINATQIIEAFQRVHQELSIKDVVKTDGIHSDGSFGQHSGILYNGNYGKDYANDVLDFEIEASDTQFAADSTSRGAFEALLDGSRWMIYRNSLTGINHWDFSVIGRFIAFAVADDQASADMKINLTGAQALGEQWSSSTLIDFGQELSKKNTTNANTGPLSGNRMFYNNDYMVHRGHNYVSTLKMYSSRSKNSECINLANPRGFHLSDGALYTHLAGNEYEDIAASWDWNLIPGITVDYGVTKFNCKDTRVTGIEEFVGGVSDGEIGLAVMRYTNPLTNSLHWQKAWFFLANDMQHVMVSSISSDSNAPVRSVLDQRLHSGPIFIDGTMHAATEALNVTDYAKSIWHGGVGYIIDPEYAILSLATGPKLGNWSAIGTSTQPPSTAFPGTTLEEFLTKAHANQIVTIRNDEAISAIYDNDSRVVMIAFWQHLGGLITFTPCEHWASVTIAANDNVVLIYRIETGEITVADPSQALTTVELMFISSPEGQSPPNWGDGLVKYFIIRLPSGGRAGSSVTQKIG
ncbi:hypothetical protein APHAL10511_006352 [Amanita phalloides]|nr:hypothetical protein APHAL10511_006352 [Amanita phalloides]